MHCIASRIGRARWRISSACPYHTPTRTTLQALAAHSTEGGGGESCLQLAFFVLCAVIVWLVVCYWFMYMLCIMVVFFCYLVYLLFGCVQFLVVILGFSSMSGSIRIISGGGIRGNGSGVLRDGVDGFGGGGSGSGGGSGGGGNRGGVVNVGGMNVSRGGRCVVGGSGGSHVPSRRHVVECCTGDGRRWDCFSAPVGGPVRKSGHGSCESGTHIMLRSDYAKYDPLKYCCPKCRSGSGHHRLSYHVRCDYRDTSLYDYLIVSCLVCGYNEGVLCADSSVSRTPVCSSVRGGARVVKKKSVKGC